ncbi:MAG: dihydroxyacetone kinase subunit DhaL [Chloroflexi bacterium]|nr:dihydroxyacetone kinase subunit DhaL [Chloroflexota bacterium]
MINNRTIVAWLKLAARSMEENKGYLTDLDAAIGDADHGINMERGFKKALTLISPVEDRDIDAILKTTGMALIGSVGGAAGPLYGTFFLDAAKALSHLNELSNTDLVLLFESGLKGIQRVGKAKPGDKTMIDTLQPALEALRSAFAYGTDLIEALRWMVQAAKEGMESTIPMVAKKGRASYLGERSAGHQDPGATSTYLLIQCLLDAVESQS